MTNVLFAWIGRNDLLACQSDGATGLGPIAQAVLDLPFDEIKLLSNFSGEESAQYAEWLRQRSSGQVTVQLIKLSSPTEHAEIYSQARAFLSQASAAERGKSSQWTFHLSPGTPAMAAIWLVLAKTKYPAALIETSQERGTRSVLFPFDLAADFLPDLIRRQDEALSRLVEGNPSAASAFESIIHRCPSMERLIWQAKMIAPRNVPVLIQGESGTGKEMLARAIHNASTRPKSSFVAVNCGAIPFELVDAELFGHTKGAFTGASQARAGYFEAANGGTLFLDEIGELPLPSQVRLLRVLQERKVTRIGATQPIDLDIRVVSATNRNLLHEVGAGRFREDLFHRLAVGILQIPSLRERGGDLLLLVDYLMEQIAEELGGGERKKISVSARKILSEHAWPGNIRELHNVLMRCVLWSQGSSISAEDVLAALLRPSAAPSALAVRPPIGEGFDIHREMQSFAAHYLREALERADGNKTKAAELLGLASYQTLSNWMRRYNIE